MGNQDRAFDRPSKRYPDEGRVDRIVATGVLASLGAGLIFGVVETLGSAILGGSLLWPMQAAASLLIRERAFLPEYFALAIPLGVSIHFSLAMLYGYAFGIANSNAAFSTLMSPVRELVLGSLYGVLLWFVNFLLIGPYLYPWLEDTRPVLQLVAHVAFFGVPLAGIFELRERRTLRRHGRL
jgi:hypothetical protein